MSLVMLARKRWSGDDVAGKSSSPPKHGCVRRRLG